ncbi:hypothetical protein [Hymenobacter negativus]|uniref:Uncharacterized protein n=1 Tax=Hymenobacter negativus TaxID=2795026 RepID=A0ABS3QA84_9BACT|nr:hypothetical protein [Hymenobacter negativus]MBO2007898.1 hypothetical protein [Hymenobacter negativus]
MNKIEYLDDNLKAVDLEMTTADLPEIDRQLAGIQVQGERLDVGLLSMPE